MSRAYSNETEKLVNRGNYRRNSRWTSASSQKERRASRVIAKKRWHTAATANRRVYGIRGPVAKAISFALDWNEKVFGPGYCVDGRNTHATTRNGMFVIQTREWGRHAPSWLVGQATRYLRSLHTRNELPTRNRIQRMLHLAHVRWEKSRQKPKSLPKRKQRRLAAAG